MKTLLFVMCLLLTSVGFTQEPTPKPEPTPTPKPEVVNNTNFQVLGVEAHPCGFVVKLDSTTTCPLSLKVTYMDGETTTTVQGPWLNTQDNQKASSLFVGDLPAPPTVCQLEILIDDEGTTSVARTLGESTSRDVLWAILGSVPETQKAIVLQSMYASTPAEQLAFLRLQTYTVQKSLKTLDYVNRLADIRAKAAAEEAGLALSVMLDGMIVNSLDE